MDCSPQGFNHRSQHLQIHPAMHKTTLNKTKLWKIKSPPLWPVLVASDYLSPYGICDLQICDIYNLTKNLSLCLHSTTTPICSKSPLNYFLNIFLRFVFYSSLFFPECTCLLALTQGHYILALLQPQMDLLDSILELKAKTRMTHISLSVFLYVK